MENTSADRLTGSYDVVVVGARVAGASTAMLLARAGHRVALVDRARFPSDTLSTHLLWPAGIVQLRRWGLLEPLVASGAPRLRTITTDVDGIVMQGPIWPESGVDEVLAPRRTVLDAMLVASAEEAGAVVLEGVSVDGLTRDGAGRVDGITGRSHDGAPVRLEARVVVGADGWRSGVARAVAATDADPRPASNAVHYAYWAGLDDRGVELWFRTSGLMAGVFPTHGGACVFVNCRTDRLSEVRGRRDGYLRLLSEAAPDLAVRLAGAARTSPVRGTPGLPGARRHPHGPGWVLVGDAGLTKDPVSAHGITAALRDAELAAIGIDRSLRDPAAESTAMRRFQADRDRLTAGLYDSAWAMASYEWDVGRLLDLQLSFVADLVREAQQVAALPDWAGVSSFVR